MTNHHLSNHQHHPKKNFGEKISIHKPDSDEKSGNDRRKTQQQQRSNRNVVELSVVPMLVPELPSHVPTPKTIETNLEPWTNKIEDALGGIHHHIQTIFSSAGDDNNIHHQHNNSSGKNNYTNRGKPIKYSPSPNTPPESPLSTSRKSKVTLTMTTPTQSKTKWGPDFWNSQKSPNNVSTNSLVTNTMIPRSPSWVGGLDDSSNAIAQTNSSSSNDDVDDDLATQDALLRVAMARKKSGRQQRDNKQSPPTTPRSVDNTMSVLRDTPPSRPCSPSSSSTGTTVGKDDVLATKVKRCGMGSISAPPLTASNKATPLPPLQLQWIHENAVNLQTTCHDHDRDSIRICDGDNEFSSLPPIMDE